MLPREGLERRMHPGGIRGFAFASFIGCDVQAAVELMSEL